MFNANQNAMQSALLFNAARVGGGKYFQAKNTNALINALKQILTEVQAVNSAFSSASLPVNATNRAQNENQVVQMREDHLEYKRMLMELNEKSAIRAEKYTQIISENTFTSNQTNLILNKINEKLNGLKI